VTLVADGPVKIGLIGDNGSGKSTFLKILAGMETADAGEVVWSRNAKIGYLEQEIVSDTFEVSGGEKKILRLTELLYSNYDAILLDEPDNHLDLDHKLWFEDLVKEYEGILVVISHDRRFLESAVDKIWHLEEKRIKEYAFGYTKFKNVYESEMLSRRQLWEAQEKERKRLAEIVIRFRREDVSPGLLSNAKRRYDKYVSEMTEKPVSGKKISLKVRLEKQPKHKTAVYLKDVRKAFAHTDNFSSN
jgi:ATPase subunit of ABC transporter with duplicated ATPase domains